MDEVEYCIECDAPATWIRSTQFAGDHPFCDRCARLEQDFDKNDSYGYWYEMKTAFDPETQGIALDDFGIEHVEANRINANERSVHLEKIKQKIEPFLNNLMRNPEKDIHWPDRDVKIAKFKEDLWKIIDETD